MNIKKYFYSKKHIQKLNKQINKYFTSNITPITKDMHITYSGISTLVMLDRYSQKDTNLISLEVGDLIVAKIKYDPKFPTLGIGVVRSILDKYVYIKIGDEYKNQIDPSFKPTNDGLIKITKDWIFKPLEIFYEQIANRVGMFLAKGEKEEEKYSQKFVKEIIDMNIVPAGRILYGAGSNTNVTYFNCFVMPMPHDSRAGISDHRKKVMEIMSRGGGVGTNGSTLRPKNTIAISVGGTSSGAVSWLNDLASLTDLIQQGGSRRGAQMIMLQIWHPDILEFIISKMQKPTILKWIADNFKDPHIKQLAKNKLKFQPLSAWQKTAFNELIKNSKDPNIVEEAKKRLHAKGEYEVIWPEFLSGANISVGITNEFMEAVKNNKKYELKFPDIVNFSMDQKEIYESEWQHIGDVRIWEKKGYPVKVYKKINARELWDLINFCATYSAEPGVFFIDRANEMTNASAYNQKVVSTNPCGEQPLAPYSVCNLSAINLNNMIDHKTGEILWEKLKNTIKISVRLQDNVTDKTPYFLEENRKQALGERRIGMGVMGLHDFLIWANSRYGSKKSLKLIDKLFEFIATTSYKVSADLGKEKGYFGFMEDVDKLLETGFIKTLPKSVKNYIKEKGGLRNSHLLTIAPTGSTGTMISISTGLEPYFAFKYYRSGRLGKNIEIDQKIVTEWKKIHNYKEDKLPDIFISAMKLAPEEHADVQTTIQRWVDSSISKTVNAPSNYSVKEVEKIYSRLYQNGAKGGTVYVDGSRNAQVLSITNEDDSKKTKMDLLLTSSSQEKITEIKEKHSDIPGSKLDKKIGIEIGDICPGCKEGTIEDIGGCNTCVNCGNQWKCDL